MSIFFRKPLAKLTIALFLGIVCLFIPVISPFSYTVYAAQPTLEQIRVSLFIDVRGTVPSVTLSSATGLQIGTRSFPWLNTPGNTPVRFSVDQYKVKIFETGDYTKARNVLNNINSSSYRGYILSTVRKGTELYQVYVGQFASKKEAEQIYAQLEQQTGIASSNYIVNGPLHWNAGSFATEADAVNRLSTIRAAGIDAYLVIHVDQAGQLIYSAWVGEASDQSQLEAIKVEAGLLIPDVTLQPINSDIAYLLKRTDATSGNAGSDQLAHFYFNGQGQQVWIAPAGTAGIKVNERSGRTYRGQIELSQHNNKLAVINELPLEAYLYGVLGAELSSSWPKEALKAQAVAARTYALANGMKYQIAHISDTTFDQAYYGIGNEFSSGIEAVDETKGEVLTNAQGLIQPLYSSNSGGLTAEGAEAWGTQLPYIQSVPSPDENAAEGKPIWYRIVLSNGKTGYIRSDLVTMTNEKNSAGFRMATVNGESVNIRPAPFVNDSNNAAIAKASAGERVTIIGEEVESNAYNWIRGPYTADQLLLTINTRSSSTISAPLQTIQITNRGPSGRVLAVNANGQQINVSTPDSLRSVLNGLPSTRFEVEQMNDFTILSASGNTRSMLQTSSQLYIAGSAGSGTSPQGVPMSQSEAIVVNKEGTVRVVTTTPMFRFSGWGFGHGLGLSQWGAKGLAELGYDYKYILNYYYKDVSIVKL